MVPRASARAAGRSLKELDVALELGSNAGIKEAVLRGMGVAVLSASAMCTRPCLGLILVLHSGPAAPHSALARCNCCPPATASVKWPDMPFRPLPRGNFASQ